MPIVRLGRVSGFEQAVVLVIASRATIAESASTLDKALSNARQTQHPEYLRRMVAVWLGGWNDHLTVLRQHGIRL